MTIKTKYAVPFTSRSSVTTMSNVLNKLVKGGIGYLKIELPVNPTFNNSVGFKIRVVSEDDKSVMFDGYISGSSSDGYNWIYGSTEESEESVVKGNPSLFCYKYLDGEENRQGNVLKSILIGSSDTDWGDLIKVSIELLQATLSTSSDGEESSVTTNGTEYSVMATSTDESNPDASWTDGWKFEIGQLESEMVAFTLSKSTKDTSIAVALEGVITGAARSDEAGNVVIDTEFTGGNIDLYDTINKRYGIIVADGSQLVNLSENKELQSMSFTSSGFDKPIVLQSSADSDVSLLFTLKDTGSTQTSKINITKLNLGEWSKDNLKRFSVKTSTEIGETSPVFTTPLAIGDLGLINNGKNTDLYVGIGKSNVLVGGAKVCNDEAEFNELDKVEGRLVVYGSKLYVAHEGSYEPVKFSGVVSLDEIKNGYFYEKVNAQAQLGGEIIRLKTDDGILLANDIYGHMTSGPDHVSTSDRNRWDAKLDSESVYTKVDVDNKMASVASSNHYHGYHNPVNEVLSGNTDFTKHNYPYGHRILVKELLDIQPYIKIAGEPNEWLEDEEFKLGDRVMSLSDYNEYMNKDNKLAKIIVKTEIVSL